jgi:hypothetical protein
MKDLNVHYMNCDDENDNMIEEQNQNNCQSCDEKCRDVDDLERQCQTCLCLGNLVPDELENTLFRCDICPSYFKKKIDFKFHARGCHWEHWDHWDQF